MKTLCIALALSLLLALSMPLVAQDEPMFNAVSRPGPRVNASLPLSSDVFINDTFAIRIPATAGGLTPAERGEIVADRLNQSFAQGLSWQEIQVLQTNGLWIVSLNGNEIVTADINSARAFGIQTGQLASRWARQSVVAMGGQPQMIAQQLLPIPGRVAGAVEELGAQWMTAPVKSVPAINVATGEQVATVTVGGAQGNLARVNAVAMYAYSANGTDVRVFVPTTATSIVDPAVPRVMGVGLVRIPAALIPTTNIRTGPAALQAIGQMTPAEWNDVVNQQLTSWNIALRASTKVVPIYSVPLGMVVGAAQIVGDANAVARTQTVALTDVDGMVGLSALSVGVPQITGDLSARTVNSALISAVITFPNDTATEMPETETEETAHMP